MKVAQSADLRPRRGSAYGRMRTREAIEGYLCIAPVLVGLLVFSLGPIVAALGISFTDWTVIGKPHFAGARNYAQLFTADPRLLRSLRVTLTYVLVAVPLHLVLSLGLALLLNRKIPGQPFFRTALYLPNLVSGVALAVLWQWMFSPRFGLINGLLRMVGIRGPDWLLSETWALPALIIMSCWGVGGTIVIFLASLQGVPEHLYEAADLDGAQAWAKFRHVTLPMVSPVLFFNLIMGLIGGFQTFTQAYVMTRGGPYDATLFYNLYLYLNAFRDYRMGYAAAMAWFLFAIILVVTLVQFRLSGRWVYYEGGVR